MTYRKPNTPTSPDGTFETPAVLAAAPSLAAAAFFAYDRLMNLSTEQFSLGGDRQMRERLRDALSKAGLIRE